jgi:transposase-like protein
MRERRAIWVTCPACQQPGGVPVTRKGDSQQRYECDDCGHEWTVSERRSANGLAAPRLQRPKDSNRSTSAEPLNKAKLP